MIGLLTLAALHLTPSERFFCDDLHEQTLGQCVAEVRLWACSKAAGGQQDSPDRIGHLYWKAVQDERAAVCRCKELQQ